MTSQDTLDIPELEGNVPGLLDPSQPSRLLRRPDSTLSFAWFDPNTAASSNPPRFDNLSLNDYCRPKRIVIETRPGVGSSWRWVPRARLRSHLQDEGTFPRLVQVCGQMYKVSQEQWDIYKLDPHYDCFVEDFSSFSVISKKELPSSGMFDSNLGSDHASVWPDLSSTTQCPSDAQDTDDMMEVDDDNSPNDLRLPHNRAAHSKRSAAYHFNFTTTRPAPTSPPSSNKRNAFVSFQNLRDPNEEENAYFEMDNQNRNTKQFVPKITKRARTMSPSTSQRAAHSHSTKRKTDKMKRMAKERAERISQRDRKMERDILADVPESAYSGNRYDFENIPEEEESDAEIHDASPQPEATVKEEGLTDAQRLAESRRKMEELNQDRAQQRILEKDIRVERPKGQRTKSEAPSREEEKRRRAEADRQQAEEELKEKQRQDRLRRERLHRKAASDRAQRNEMWNHGPWDDNRAIERFRQTCRFFDDAKFSAETLPLTWTDIPWPTLRHPSVTTPADINWQSVSEFVEKVRKSFREQDFKDFMKTNVRRFHPDRWANRNCFNAVIDEQVRGEIETSVTTVSQAINDLNTKLK